MHRKQLKTHVTANIAKLSVAKYNIFINTISIKSYYPQNGSHSHSEAILQVK